MMNENNNAAAKTFVLVHGAWLAPWAWNEVSEELTSNGHTVTVIELPGHGEDQTPTHELSINAYRDHIIDIVGGTSGFILVGHSLAGMVISAVAEAIPEKIAKLIYVGAYLPADGQSLLALANTDARSHLGPAIVPSADQLTLNVGLDKVADIFSADSSPEIQQKLVASYRPEPAIPFTNEITLTADNFGRVAKIYVHTLKDHAISPDLQRRMVAASIVDEVFELDSSHTPFLSMPGQLSSLLIQQA